MELFYVTYPVAFKLKLNRKRSESSLNEQNANWVLWTDIGQCEKSLSVRVHTFVSDFGISSVQRIQNSKLKCNNYFEPVCISSLLSSPKFNAFFHHILLCLRSMAAKTYKGSTDLQRNEMQEDGIRLMCVCCRPCFAFIFSLFALFLLCNEIVWTIVDACSSLVGCNGISNFAACAIFIIIVCRFAWLVYENRISSC